MNHKLKIASPQIVAQYEHIFKSQMIPPINGILTQLPILDRLTSGGSPALAPITPPRPTLPILPLIPIVPSQARRWDYLLNGEMGLL